MENVARIIGIVLIVVGTISIARSALSGGLTLGAVVVPLILIFIGAFLLK